MIVESTRRVEERLAAGAIAKILGVHPEIVSSTLYRRFYGHPLVVLHGRRKLVDPALIPTIRELLATEGKLPATITPSGPDGVGVATTRSAASPVGATPAGGVPSCGTLPGGAKAAGPPGGGEGACG